jgi:hypothetical protein
MTRQNVLDDITAKITGKTTAGSLSNIEDGANRVLIMDYIDQEVKSKVLKTTITGAQVLQLFDTPITILDSSESGKVKYPTNVYVKRNTGTAYTLASASFSVINDFSTAMSGNLNPNPLSSTSVGFFQSEINVVQNLSGSDKNVLYKLKANTGNPTVGTGDLDVYVTYIEITL